MSEEIDPGVGVVGNDEEAVLYDERSDTAFGPLFDSTYEGLEFVAWVKDQGGPDVRTLLREELGALVETFRAAEVSSGEEEDGRAPRGQAGLEEEEEESLAGDEGDPDGGAAAGDGEPPQGEG